MTTRLLMGLTWGVGLAVAPAWAQTYRYSVTIVPPLPGHTSVGFQAINNHGEVVGVSYGSPVSNQTPIIWRPGTGTQALPMPPGGYAFSVPTDINDAGVIVGYAQPTWSAEQSMVPWKYENGQFTVYSGVSLANNINNPGTIVGRACLSGTQLTCYFKIEPGGPMQTIASAGWYSSSQWRFIDINDAGQIVYTPPSGNGAATLRQPDGTLVSLPFPPPPYVRTLTWAINNAGQVIARWEYNIGTQYFSRAFLWSQQGGTIEIGIPDIHVRPKGINNLGHVVGESGHNQNSYVAMWLWTPERGNEDLEPLIDPTLQIVLTGVSGINDLGQILAGGIRQVPPVEAVQFVLTPVSSSCYANCDGSTTAPVLNVADFTCFLQRFANGDPYANCDGSTTVPVLNVADFTCFLQRFAAGCP